MAGKKKITSNIDKIFSQSTKSTHDNIFLNAEIKDILELVQQYDSDEKLRDILASYLMIRLVTYFEVSMAEVVTNHIDLQKNFDFSKIFTGEWSIPISKIPTIINQKLTSNTIVRASFNFQDIDDVNYICSKLLKLEFLNTIKNMSRGFDNDYYEESAKKLSKNWKKFLDIFTHRHKIAHTITYYGHRRLDYTESLVDLMIIFIEFTGILFSVVHAYHSGELKKYPKMSIFIDKKLKEQKK